MYAQKRITLRPSNESYARPAWLSITRRWSRFRPLHSRHKVPASIHLILILGISTVKCSMFLVKLGVGKSGLPLFAGTLNKVLSECPLGTTLVIDLRLSDHVTIFQARSSSAQLARHERSHGTESISLDPDSPVMDDPTRHHRVLFLTILFLFPQSCSPFASRRSRPSSAIPTAGRRGTSTRMDRTTIMCVVVLRVISASPNIPLPSFA
ncbi:hypothetical protein CPB85DRAFT_957284 [Mucidula mucida]|nr:hypothetical protein CPB85DRAFT_957284 [Mucidula mucida]